MGEKGILSDLSTIERAWTFAKIDSNSTFFAKFGKISDMNQVRSLYEYYKAQPTRDAKHRDLDSMDNDKLRKYFVITIDDPTGTSENGKIDLIVDSTGHDIGITYLGKDGMKFEISPNIIKNNSKMIEGLDLAVDMKSEDVAKLLAPKDIDALVEEINKNDTVAMRSTIDAKKRAEQYDKDEERAKIKLDPKRKSEVSEEREEEIDAELKENSNIPQEMYSNIQKICLENGLNPNDLKQTITVQNPSALIEQIDNSKTNVRENGGEVTVLRFKNKEANSEADKIFMVQGGELLKKDEKNDEKVAEIMEDHKGNNVKVQDFEDTRIVELEAELERIKIEYESEKAQIEENVANLEITDSFTEEDREHARQSMLDELDTNYEEKVQSVCEEFCPPRTSEIQNIENDAIENVEKGRDPRETIGNNYEEGRVPKNYTSE